MAKIGLASYTGFEDMLNGILDGKVVPKQSNTTDIVYASALFNSEADGSTAEQGGVFLDLAL